VPGQEETVAAAMRAKKKPGGCLIGAATRKCNFVSGSGGYTNRRQIQSTGGAEPCLGSFERVVGPSKGGYSAAAEMG
jgi:hypothetical protein